ncbi:MAG: hypothetical protein R3F17_09140 [Planctomycetota bacterium]
MKDSVVSLTVKIGFQTSDGGQMVVLGAIVCNGEASGKLHRHRAGKSA